MSVYISVSKGDMEMGVLKIEDENDLINIFNKMYDNGFEIKKITEEEYNSVDYGDELSSDDINNGNYKIE